MLDTNTPSTALPNDADLALDEAAFDREIARVVKRSKPRLSLPRPLAVMALLSLVSHTAVAVALAMAHPGSAPEDAFQVPREERILNLDLSAFVLPEDPALPAPVVEPEIIEVAHVTPRPTSEARPRETTPPVTRPTPVVEAPVNVASAVQLPQEAPSEAPATPPTASSQLVASASGHVALSGPPRTEAPTASTDDVDLAGLRRGHLSRLNRALRSQNPCSPALRRSAANGDVIVALQQNEDGSIASVRVARSSGNSEVDGAALDFVRAQRRLPRPESLLLGDTWTLPLRFECGR